MKIKSKPFSEFDWIKNYLSPIAGEGALSLEDDAAFVNQREGYDLVITKDALVENVHFFCNDTPESIAHKALAVNISDLAAKGAKPRGFFLGFGRNENQSEDWLKRFAIGIKEASEVYSCPILGGDTVSAPFIFLSITAIGEVPKGCMVRRQGKENQSLDGNIIYVTGTIGDSALGLEIRLHPEAEWVKKLSHESRLFLENRYLRPQPRLELAPIILSHANASMDISDGLIGDCDKLCKYIGKDFQLNSIPLSKAAREAVSINKDLIEKILTGGDDYEIISCIPPKRAESFELCAAAKGVSITKIGIITKIGAETNWFDDQDVTKQFYKRSYEHF